VSGWQLIAHPMTFYNSSQVAESTVGQPGCRGSRGLEFSRRLQWVTAQYLSHLKRYEYLARKWCEWPSVTTSQMGWLCWACSKFSTRHSCAFLIAVPVVLLPGDCLQAEAKRGYAFRVLVTPRWILIFLTFVNASEALLLLGMLLSSEWGFKDFCTRFRCRTLYFQ